MTSSGGMPAWTLTSWLRRHPLLGYFALCFGISWGGILLILAATGFSLAALQPLETDLTSR
jgi:hypothetical protein